MKIILILSFTLDCETGKILIEIHRIYGANPAEEKLEIYEGSVALGTKIHTETGRNSAYLENIIELCISNTPHSFLLTTSSYSGWAMGSHVYVKMNGFEVLRARLEDKAREEVLFNPVYVISSTTQWYYSHVAQTTPNWIYAVPSGWQLQTPGLFPNVDSNTRYYVCSITIPPLHEGYPIFEFGVYSREGVVVYIKGEEVIRKNLPNGPITSTTVVNKLDATSSYLRFVGSRLLYMSGSSVTIAVEIHKDVNSTLPYIDDFKAYLLPIQNTPNYRVADGVASCKTVSPTDDNVENLFDDNKGTMWTNYIIPAVDVVYTFNNRRREWFNQYSLTSSSSHPERDPLSWRVEGSMDGISWNRIDYQSNVVFASRLQTLIFKVASNRISYNMVRLSIISLHSKSEVIAQLAEFRLFATTDLLLDDGLQYAVESATYMTGITDDFSLRPKSSGFQSYGIRPSLPEGMSIDVDSGEISGATIISFKEFVTYNITAMSSVKGVNFTTSIRILFTSCDDDLHTRLDVVKYNVPGSNKETFQMLCNDGMFVQDSEGHDAHDTQIYHICTLRGVCELTMRDKLGDAWSAGAYLDLTIYNHGNAYSLGRSLVSDSDVQKVLVNTDFFINEKSTDMKFYTGAEYKNEWYKDTAFIASAAFVNMSIPLNSTRQHWYVYTSVTTPVPVKGQVYSVRFFCRAGAVLYVNGEEQYRVNVPAGPMTATTAITGGSNMPYWHTFTGRLASLKTCTNCVNTFAFDITNAVSDATIAVDFDMSVYIYMSSDKISFTEGVIGEGTSVSSSYPASRMVDGDWASYTLLNRDSRDSKHWLGVKYPEGSRYFVSHYCVTCNPETSRFDPTEWDFVAANDDSALIEQWEKLDTQSNVRFMKREQRLCFEIKNNKSYGYYRLYMKANRNIYPTNGFAVAELELFGANNSTVPTFTYSVTNLVLYRDEPMPTMTSTRTAGTVSVTPGLPAGLVLDTNSGRISGTPTQLSAATTYKLINTINDIKLEATISISVVTCDSAKQLFTVHFPTTGALGPTMMFSVYKNTADDEANKIFSASNLPIQEELFYQFCMEPVNVVVVAASTESNSWGMYYLEVMMEDRTVIGHSVYNVYQPDVYFPFYHVRPLANWKYTYSSVTDITWNTKDYSAAAWNENKAGLFGTLTSTTQYYRSTFSVSNVEMMSTVMYRVKVSAGCVIYINGHEIYRVNMPIGTPTSNTLPTSEYLTTQTITGTAVLSSTLLVNGVNVLAIEMHRLNTAEEENDFSATLLIVNYLMYAMNEGVPSADIMNDGSHGYLKAFDFTRETYYESGPRCEGTILQWSYPIGSRYAVNSYELASKSNTCVAKFPTAWAMEGSNDGNTWSMIDYQQDMFNYLPGTSFSSTFYATETFNMFRLRVTECKNLDMQNDCSVPGVLIAEFSMFHANIAFDKLCHGDLSFGDAVMMGYSFGECPAGYIGYRRRYCQEDLLFGPVENLCSPESPSFFSYPQNIYELTVGIAIAPSIIPTAICTACVFTSNPILPKSLVLDSATGAISGMGLNVTQAFFYTITGRNNAGSISATLRIALVSSGANCPPDFTNSWGSAVAGTNATRGCPDSVNYRGNMTRFCKNTVPPTWDAPIDMCVLLPPNITYTQSNVTLEKNVEMTVLVPVIFGAEIIEITVNPILPSGMYMSSAGLISGAPTVKNLVGTSYTVTIKNAAGSAQFVILIIVTSPTCPLDGIWAETDRGDKAWNNCEAQKEGEYYRVCSATTPPVWQTPVNTCTYRAPIISYPTPALVIHKGVAMTAQSPIVSNFAQTWSSTPTLPTGLALSTTTGVISGTPTQSSAQESYTVKAANPDRFGTTVITIEVDVLMCQRDGDWPERELGTVEKLGCANPQEMTGERTRTCSYNGATVSWGLESSTCVYKQPYIAYTSGITAYKDEAIAAVEPKRDYRITLITVTPSLPLGLSLDSKSGIISGTPTVGSARATYVVRAINENASADTNIQIEVIVPTCATTGEWLAVERGTTSYVYCEGQSGVRTRTCGKKSDRTPKWSDVDATMCMTSPEKTKPSEGRSFVRFNLMLSGVTKTSLGAYGVEMVRIAFHKGIQSQGIALNRVVVQSFNDADVALFSAGVSLSIRIDVASDNVNALKAQMEDNVNNKKQLAVDLKALGSPFETVAVRLDTGSYSVKKYSSMNAVVIVLIVILILFLLIFAGIFMFYINIRSKSAAKGGVQQLGRSNGFIPEGNVRDSGVNVQYERKTQRVNVSDSEEERAPRRTSKRQSRFVDESSEEEEEEIRPSRKNKGMKARV